MLLAVQVGQGHRHHGGLVDVVPAHPLGLVAAAGEPLLDLCDARGQHRVGLRRVGLDQRQGDHGRLADLLAGRLPAQVLDPREDRLFLLRAGQREPAARPR